jgi:hypothetical protein
MQICYVGEHHITKNHYYYSITYLSSVLPGNTSERLNSKSTKRSQHGPPPMNQLALPEPLQPKHLGIRLERRGLHVISLGPCPNNITSQVLSQVLVQRVQVILQILSWLSKPKWVEPIIPNEAPVQPFRSFSSRVPKWAIVNGLCCSLRWAFLLPESEPGLDSARVCVHVREPCSNEGGCSGSGGGGGGGSHGVGLTCAECEVSAG